MTENFFVKICERTLKYSNLTFSLVGYCWHAWLQFSSLCCFDNAFTASDCGATVSDSRRVRQLVTGSKKLQTSTSHCLHSETLFLVSLMDISIIITC